MIQRETRRIHMPANSLKTGRQTKQTNVKLNIGGKLWNRFYDMIYVKEPYEQTVLKCLWIGLRCVYKTVSTI